MTWWSSTDPPTVPPGRVDATEPLARSVHSSKSFKKGRSQGEPGRVLASAFDPPKDAEAPGQQLREVSTDRCQYLAQDKAVELAKDRADKRGMGFHGWAIIAADDARKSGRDVVPSRARDQDNPAHADIVLPADTTNEDEIRNPHLLELARHSYWLAKLCP